MEIDQSTGLVVRRPPRPWPGGLSSVADLLNIGAASPEHPALVDGGRSWTYSELDLAVARACGALVERSLGAGDRIVWCSPNRAEIIIGFLATCRIGAVWAGLNAASTPSEQTAVIADVEPVVCVGTATRGSIEVEALLNEWDQAEPAKAGLVDPHAPGAIAYTSGTTGTPKGVVHSQHNLLTQAAVSIATDPVKPFERHGSPLALTILNIMALGPIAAFARGATYYVMTSTRSADFASAIEDANLTHTLVVPTMVHDLVTRDDVGASQLASLRTVLIGGSNAPVAERRRFHDRFGVRAVTSYGLSEAPGGVVREPVDAELRAGGVGLSQLHVSITTDGGNGEICVSPASIGQLAGCWSPMLGYWRQPDATAAALSGDTLRTGDVGTIDEHGWVTITGRLSEVIVRGGANVMPAEVEAVLNSHNQVVDAAVFGLADERLGERVVACVVTSGPVDESMLITHCSVALAAYKVPDSIVFTDDLPRNAMGKVSIGDVRDLVASTKSHP